jgi:cyclophilin family peptidyl-prolyl cis-trans isomerase
MLVALLILAQAAASPAAEPSASPAPSGPIVTLETSLGSIRIQLDKQKAPLTVDNFLKYIRAGHYDGTIFHRVIPNFMIQGGGLDEKMGEAPTRPPIKNEAKNGLRNERGTISMARTNEPDSATAQFFINLKDNAALDYGVRGAGYAVFGRVVEGMDVVDKIAAVRTTMRGDHENVPVAPVVIKRVREAGGATAKPAKPASPRPSPNPGRS